MVRRDCFFKNYPNDLNSILHSELGKRDWEGKASVDTPIDPIFEQIDTFEEMTGRASKDPESWENQLKSPTFGVPISSVKSRKAVSDVPSAAIPPPVKDIPNQPPTGESFINSKSVEN